MANSFGLASKKVTQVTLTGAVGCLIGAIVGELVLLFLPAASVAPATPQVDVMFVADVTGSMQDEIDGIRDGIREFADTLGRAAVDGDDAEKQLDVQVGLVAFRDNRAGERSEVLNFDGQPLTAQYDEFRRQVARLLADGGDDEPESSLDAMGQAAALSFRPEATKVLLLITDAPPHVPDVNVRSVEELEGILKQHEISQLHLVVPERFRSDYAPLQEAIPGDVFPLERGSHDFGKVLPEMGERIAETTLQGISGLKSYAAEDFTRLVIVYGLWTACLAVGIALALIAGQNYYLGRKLLSKKEAILGAAGGAVVGTLAGAAGQMLYSGASLGEVGRIVAWAMLGALVGGGMAFFVPNLNVRQSFKFGAVGGAAGAVGFLLASWILVEVLGRFVGAAILGFFIALVVAIVEMVYRQAWLEVKYGEKEVKFVTLGAQPVRVGSDGQRCAVYAPEARPLAYEYRLENGEVKITDFAKEQTSTVQPGDRRTMGRVTVTVCTGNDASKVAPPIQAAPPPPPPKAKTPDPQKHGPSGAPSPQPTPTAPGAPASVAPVPRRETAPLAGRGTGSPLPPPPPPPPRKKTS